MIEAGNSTWQRQQSLSCSLAEALIFHMWFTAVISYLDGVGGLNLHVVRLTSSRSGERRSDDFIRGFPPNMCLPLGGMVIEPALFRRQIEFIFNGTTSN